MTPNTFKGDRTAYLATGMNDHLGKPVDPEQWCTATTLATADATAFVTRGFMA